MLKPSAMRKRNSCKLSYEMVKSYIFSALRSGKTLIRLEPRFQLMQPHH